LMLVQPRTAPRRPQPALSVPETRNVKSGERPPAPGLYVDTMRGPSRVTCNAHPELIAMDT